VHRRLVLQSNHTAAPPTWQFHSFADGGGRQWWLAKLCTPGMLHVMVLVGWC
jgi:hypothetical protein